MLLQLFFVLILIRSVVFSSLGSSSYYFQLSSPSFLNNTGSTFQVTLRSYLEDRKVGQVTYSYSVSDFLVTGDCEVIPISGTAIFTDFVIHCQGIYI